MLRLFARPFATRIRRHKPFRRARCRLEVMQLDERIAPAVTLSSGMTGMNNTGWTPPDPNLGVGPGYVIEIVNESMAIYNKSTGALVSSQALTSLFAGLVAGTGPFDPSVVYDESAGRFIIEAAVDDSAHSKSYVDFAVSNSSDPTQGFTEVHQIEVDQGGQYWADNGKLGFNNDAIVYTGNLYTFANAGAGEVIVSIAKSSVTDQNNSTLTSYVTTQNGNFSMIPARMHNSTAGGPMWFVMSTWSGSSTMYVYRMDNVLSSTPTFTLTAMSVNAYSPPSTNPPQPGGTVEVVDSRVLNVEWNNNYLVAGLDSTSGSDAAAAWFEFNTSGTKPVLSQQGVIHPGTGIATYFPAVGVDSTGDLALTYMESSATEYVSMYVTGRLASDPANTLEPGVLAKAGTVTLSPSRAGDYAGIALDPSAPNTYWAANEYALSGYAWGVYLAQFTVTGTSGTNIAPAVATPASASPNPVTGTTTNLSVLGSDTAGDTLTYTWSVTSQPSGSTTPAFSANASSTANNTTATFYQAGNYTFQVTITDSGGLTVTSSVDVTVNQTLTSVSVTPASATLVNSGTQQFTATGLDQFGKAMTVQPSFTWSLGAGSVGALSSAGLYTAPAAGGGSATVTATTGSLSASASVTVSSIPAAPTNLTATAKSKTEIDLSWSESSTNVTGFKVQRSTNGGKSWTQIGTTTGTTYADKTVSKGKTYWYRVAAYNSVGTSGWSNTASATAPNFRPLHTTSLFPAPDVPSQGEEDDQMDDDRRDDGAEDGAAIDSTDGGRLGSNILSEISRLLRNGAPASNKIAPSSAAGHLRFVAALPALLAYFSGPTPLPDALFLSGGNDDADATVLDAFFIEFDTQPDSANAAEA